MNIKDVYKKVPKEWKNSGTNLLFYGDPHFNSKAPSTRLDDYEETEFNKVREIIKIADEYNVKLYINPGDMTDVPRLDNSYLTRLMDVWGFYDVDKARTEYDSGTITEEDLTKILLHHRPTISVVGNHDTNFRRGESGSALRFLSDQKFINLVYETEPYLLKLHNGSTLAISATPYWIGQMDGVVDPKTFTPKHNLGDVKIHLNHNNVYEREFQEGLAWVDTRDVAEVTTADLTLNGHIHLQDSPVSSKDGKRVVWNPGAFGQVSASPSELKRDINVVLIHIDDDNNIDMRAVKLDTPLSEDIFDLSIKQNKLSVKKQLQNVKNIISKVDVGDKTKVNDIIDSVAKSSQVSTVVKELAIDKTDEVISDIGDDVDIDPNINYKIKEIVLRNFEAHKETHIKLDDTSNLLIGESSQGKSSILRAVYWALENKGDGKSFIRRSTGVNSASVELIREDGTSVTRVIETEFGKTGKLKVVQNGWVIKYTDGKVTETNTGGLEEVHNIFGLTYLKLDQKDKVPLNFLKQGDSSFFIHETPAKRAKIIGSLYGTQYILSAIKGLEAERRKLETSKKVVTSGIKAIESKITPLDKIEDTELKLKQIKLEQKALIENEAKYNSAKEKYEALVKLSDGIDKVKTFVSTSENKIMQSPKTILELEVATNKYAKISDLLNKYTESSVSITENSDILKSKSKIDDSKIKIRELSQMETSLSRVERAVIEFNKTTRTIDLIKPFVSKEVSLSSISRLTLDISNDLSKFDKASTIINRIIKSKLEIEKLNKEIDDLKSDISKENDSLLKEQGIEMSNNKLVISNIVFYNVSPGGTVNVNSKIEEIKERVDKMTNLMVRAQTKLEDAEKRKGDAEKELKDLNIDPKNAEKELSQLKEDINTKYIELDKTVSEVEAEAQKMNQ